MNNETIDSQRQYILFLEKKIATLMERLCDTEMDYNDAHQRVADLRIEIELLERAVDLLEKERANG